MSEPSMFADLEDLLPLGKDALNVPVSLTDSEAAEAAADYAALVAADIMVIGDDVGGVYFQDARMDPDDDGPMWSEEALQRASQFQLTKPQVERLLRWVSDQADRLIRELREAGAGVELDEWRPFIYGRATPELRERAKYLDGPLRARLASVRDRLVDDPQAEPTPLDHIAVMKDAMQRVTDPQQRLAMREVIRRFEDERAAEDGMRSALAAQAQEEQKLAAWREERPRLVAALERRSAEHRVNVEAVAGQARALAIAFEGALESARDVHRLKTQIALGDGVEAPSMRTYSVFVTRLSGHMLTILKAAGLTQFVEHIPPQLRSPLDDTAD